MKNKNFTCCFIFSLCFHFATQAQIIATIAGTGAAGFGGDGGPASAALFDSPVSVMLDNVGNIYVADSHNNRIRKVSAAGWVSTIAGNGTAGIAGEGGPATDASISYPTNVALDIAGNIYVSIDNNYCVGKISTTGIIRNVAGVPGNSCGGCGGDGAPATLAILGALKYITVDGAGNILIPEASENRIRKVNPSGIISTVAGIITPGFTGDGGPATNAELNNPYCSTIDDASNIYISDRFNNRIRKINSSGIISTFAGNGTAGFSGDGGPASAAEFNEMADIVFDHLGNMFIADEGNNRIRKINTSGIVSTVAGNGIAGYTGDGCAATAAELYYPRDIAIDPSGRLYIADMNNNVIRMVYVGPGMHFTGSRVQSFSVCENSSVDSINSLLTVMDSLAGRTETWSIISPPAYGSLYGTCSAASTGGMLSPVGLYYSAGGGYAGADSFKIRVSNCGGISDTTTIHVNIVPPPVAGAIAGPDTVCPGNTIMLSDTSAGTWSASNGFATISGGMASGVATGVDTIFYIGGNWCGADTAALILNVNDCTNEIKPVSGRAGIRIQCSVYPDPNDGTFTLLLSEDQDEPVHFEFTNLAGQKVKQLDAITNRGINVKLDEPPGIYFVSATIANGVYNTRVTIAK